MERLVVFWSMTLSIVAFASSFVPVKILCIPNANVKFNVSRIRRIKMCNDAVHKLTYCECACLCKSVRSFFLFQCRKGFYMNSTWKGCAQRALRLHNAILYLLFAQTNTTHLCNACSDDGVPHSSTAQSFDTRFYVFISRLYALVHWLVLLLLLTYYLNVSDLTDKETKLKIYLHDKCLLVSGYECSIIYITIVSVWAFNDCDWIMFSDKWK